MATLTQDDLRCAVNTFFDQKKWLYTHPEEDLYMGTMRIETPSVSQMPFSVKVLPFGFINSCTVPIAISSECLPQIAEYLHRVNCLLLRGCFELDYQRRKCFYKMVSMTSSVCESARLNGIVEELFLVPSEMIAIFSNGICEVQEGAEPKVVVDRIIESYRSGK